MKDSKCDICRTEYDSFELKKCPICHKMICENCIVAISGIHFCSKQCSEFFFFGDEEIEDLKE